eukprot:SAG22_NODE_18080_length_293_cov_2.360825_1_plen_23_part_01
MHPTSVQSAGGALAAAQTGTTRG